MVSFWQTEVASSHKHGAVLIVCVIRDTDILLYLSDLWNSQNFIVGPYNSNRKMSLSSLYGTCQGNIWEIFFSTAWIACCQKLVSSHTTGNPASTMDGVESVTVIQRHDSYCNQTIDSAWRPGECAHSMVGDAMMESVCFSRTMRGRVQNTDICCQLVR